MKPRSDIKDVDDINFKSKEAFCNNDEISVHNICANFVNVNNQLLSLIMKTDCYLIYSTFREVELVLLEVQAVCAKFIFIEAIKDTNHHKTCMRKNCCGIIGFSGWLFQ